MASNRFRSTTFAEAGIALGRGMSGFGESLQAIGEQKELLRKQNRALQDRSAFAEGLLLIHGEGVKVDSYDDAAIFGGAKVGDLSFDKYSEKVAQIIPNFSNSEMQTLFLGEASKYWKQATKAQDAKEKKIKDEEAPLEKVHWKTITDRAGHTKEDVREAGRGLNLPMDVIDLFVGQAATGIDLTPTQESQRGIATEVLTHPEDFDEKTKDWAKEVLAIEAEGVFAGVEGDEGDERDKVGMDIAADWLENPQKRTLAQVNNALNVLGITVPTEREVYTAAAGTDIDTTMTAQQKADEKTLWDDKATPQARDAARIRLGLSSSLEFIQSVKIPTGGARELIQVNLGVLTGLKFREKLTEEQRRRGMPAKVMERFGKVPRIQIEDRVKFLSAQLVEKSRFRSLEDSERIAIENDIKELVIALGGGAYNTIYPSLVTGTEPTPKVDDPTKVNASMKAGDLTNLSELSSAVTIELLARPNMDITEFATEIHDFIKGSPDELMAQELREYFGGESTIEQITALVNRIKAESGEEEDSSLEEQLNNNGSPADSLRNIIFNR